MRPQTIYCPTCKEPCGKLYPARISMLDGGEPEFAEGIGENYVYKDDWYCSQECMDKAMRSDADD